MSKVQVNEGGGSAAMLVAALAATMGYGSPRALPRKSRTRVPMMVTASREEIAAWNQAVANRNAARRDQSRSAPWVSGTHRQQKRARMAPLRNSSGAS